jgi:hypothetical protein
MNLVIIAWLFCPHYRAWPLDAAKLACMAYRIYWDDVADLKPLPNNQVYGAPVTTSC